MADETGGRARTLLRRRRENVAGGRQHSHRVLVTPEEEARLVLAAEGQGVTVPRLLIESALAPGGETITERRAALAELFAQRRELTGIATNINQMAAKANAVGEFPTRDQADGMFEEIRAIVATIDDTLYKLRVS